MKKILIKIFDKLYNIMLSSNFKFLLEYQYRFNRLEKDIYDLKQKIYEDNFSTKYKLVSDHLISENNADQVHPRGTKNDNTRHLRLVNTMENHFKKKLSHLDLGCGGGGLVFDFLINGHISIGLDGSDFAKKGSLHHWQIIKNNLFCADISKPFEIKDFKSSEKLNFDLITAFEVLEHLEESDIQGLINNLKENMHQKSIFMCSIATFEDKDEKIVWHKTVKSKDWWVEKFTKNGFKDISDQFSYLDYSRGSSNITTTDWNAFYESDLGFHLALGISQK